MKKPRNAYTDHTRKERASRRTALLNVAAMRMGYGSWIQLAGGVLKALK